MAQIIRKGTAKEAGCIQAFYWRVLCKEKCGGKKIDKPVG